MVEQNTQQTAPSNEIEQNMPEGIKSAFDAVREYKKQIIFGLAAILAIAGLWTGLNWHSANALAEARDQLGETLLTTSGDERITKLEELVQNVPSEARAAVLFELATLCLDERKYEKAVDHYGALAEDTEGETRVVALLGKTKAMMLYGKAGEAVAILKDMAAEAGEGLVVPVNRQLAVAAEQAGDRATALAALEKLQETGSADKQFVEYKLNLLKNS